MSDRPARDPLERQMAHPRGWGGWVAGQLMAWRNADRARWIVGHLALRRGATVLELGFGPGVAVARLAGVRGLGAIVGVDSSTEMVRLASARNRAAIRAGRVRLIEADARAIPLTDDSADVVFATDCVQHWTDRPAVLREIVRVLRPGGQLLLAVQPVGPAVSDRDTELWAGALRAELVAAGFEDLAEHRYRPGGATAALVAVSGMRGELGPLSSQTPGSGRRLSTIPSG